MTARCHHFTDRPIDFIFDAPRPARDLPEKELTYADVRT
jgi:hypothetical protein